MADLFSASELINIAIREEVTGATFYRAVADKAASDKLKQFARDTADMEDVHADKFRQLLGEVGDYKPVAESYAGEYQEYLAYLLEGRIFPMGEDGKKMAAEMASDAEAVQRAADMEKSTLLLYQELLKFVPEKQHAVLESIMDEERQHLLRFTKFMEEGV